MESRYKYLYDAQAVRAAFMGSAQAYITLTKRGVLSAEAAMLSLADDLKEAKQRLTELNAMGECTKVFPPISNHEFIVPLEPKLEEIPVGKRLCDFYPTLHEEDNET